jgi:hypothetical protein
MYILSQWFHICLFTRLVKNNIFTFRETQEARTFIFAKSRSRLASDSRENISKTSLAVNPTVRYWVPTTQPLVRGLAGLLQMVPGTNTGGEG